MLADTSRRMWLFTPHYLWDSLKLSIAHVTGTLFLDMTHSLNGWRNVERGLNITTRVPRSWSTLLLKESDLDSRNPMDRGAWRSIIHGVTKVLDTNLWLHNNCPHLKSSVLICQSTEDFWQQQGLPEKHPKSWSVLQASRKGSISFPKGRTPTEPEIGKFYNWVMHH